MPDPTRATCQSCGKHKSECGPISWSGLCRDCGIALMTGNIVGVATRDGYPYRQWKRRMRQWALSLPLDEPAVSTHTTPEHA